MQATVSVLIPHLMCFHMRPDESNIIFAKSPLGYSLQLSNLKVIAPLHQPPPGDWQVSLGLSPRKPAFLPLLCLILIIACSLLRLYWNLLLPVYRVMLIPAVFSESSIVIALNSHCDHCTSHLWAPSGLRAYPSISITPCSTQNKQCHVMETDFTRGTSLKDLLTFCLFTKKQMLKYLLKYCEIFSQIGHLVPAA